MESPRTVVTTRSMAPFMDVTSSLAARALSSTLGVSTLRVPAGGSGKRFGGSERVTVMAARATRRSRKFSWPWDRSMSDLTRANSLSIASTSLTAEALSNSANRLFSSRSALSRRAFRSMNLSDTSSEPWVVSWTLPKPSICSNTGENSVCGTRTVIVARCRSGPPPLVRCSTKPPALSAMVRTRAAASWTASTSRDTEAVEITFRSAI